MQKIIGIVFFVIMPLCAQDVIDSSSRGVDIQSTVLQRCKNDTDMQNLVNKFFIFCKTQDQDRKNLQTLERLTREEIEILKKKNKKK
jgi:hypothetical protein